MSGSDVDQVSTAPWDPMARRGDHGAPVRWRDEALTALAIAAFSAVAGGVAGLIWAATAAHISVLAEVNGSATADKALIGQDVLFAEIGVSAGLVVLLLVWLFGRWHHVANRMLGPGTAIGLAVGGVLGGLVEEAVGHARRHAAFTATFDHLLASLSPSLRAFYAPGFDFGLKAKGLLLLWPVVVVVIHAFAVILSDGDRSSPGST